MSEPLEFINLKRALSALRPLDPNRPVGQVEPWTLFDIEHYALSLGWQPPVGYRLAIDPRFVIPDPLAWWREFLTRYYRPGAEPGQGSLVISHNFGPPIGNVLIGEILMRADLLVSSGYAVGLPFMGIWKNQTPPERYREAMIESVRMAELRGPLAQWPLSDSKKSAMIEFMAEGFRWTLEPRDMRAMPL